MGQDKDISINKKKSGILIIQNGKLGRDQINGYPIKKYYKYLGVELDSSLSPKVHLNKVHLKLRTYIDRNQWLIRKYFSPKSLINICNYFQMSRLSYGMCSFLDTPEIMKALETMKMHYLRSMLGFKENISSDRLRLALNSPLLEFELFTRLNQVLITYQKHFGEFPKMYHEIILLYRNELEITGLESKSELMVKSKRASIRRIANREGIKVGDGYYIGMTYLYVYPDRRERFLIRVLTKAGMFDTRLFPSCLACKSINSRKHIINDCEYLKEYREKLSKVLAKLKREEVADLEEEILTCIFNPPALKPKEWRLMLNSIKEFVAQIFCKLPPSGTKDNLKTIVETLESSGSSSL